MTVLITVSETINGAPIGDALVGGGFGADLGSVISNQYAPLIDKTANTGAQTFYLRHNAVTDPITGVGFYIQQYGLNTGYTYGGDDSAAGNIADIIGLGAASGSSKNNADGLSGGLWIDMDADASVANQFNQQSFPTLVKIFGDNGTDGIDIPSAFTLKADALVYYSPAEVLASAPVDGQIGKLGDSVLGDRAKLKMRIYIPGSFADSGTYQAELVTKYSFTA